MMCDPLFHITLLYILHIFSIYDSYDLRSSVGGYMAIWRFCFRSVGFEFLFLFIFMDLERAWRSLNGAWRKRDWISQ